MGWPGIPPGSESVFRDPLGTIIRAALRRGNAFVCWTGKRWLWFKIKER